ncbi:3-phenylpropionate/trans-cinnamate dioxygenase ferredoxin reductase subunit [Actinomycetospora succinea]|uniref:3-phenylpropionate/trans-cinnamate dioxygenase ferredoxin reductase subunit n=1 Tax=Actinomycetospora succinea TaxID=663603 RepID=A0A4R6UYX0_9PSEU|nr:FAD-dependent oxidoreductase [Actinomycetospora succinea]TDQ52742.1 3-phenylpropionate/trans-cinnamate dioxygenase ferredoxin reductase subunit [Actinomycetospora succinea]
MADEGTHVIVGAGLAGAKAAETLREDGFAGRVVLIGEEQERPYDRPPLSKEYLQGNADRDAVYLHTADWYAEHGVELRSGTRAAAIDRDAHEVVLADGERVGYRKLLLATGSSPRRLPVAGADLDGVHYLRTLGDSDTIAATIRSSSRIVVVGGGWIGLEVTAAARIADVAVTVVESAPLPLLRVLGPEIAEVFATLHREHGVDLRVDTDLAEITGRDGRVTGVRLADGTEIDADAVVVGVGITPNTDLAEAAGLEVSNGVVVDTRHRTSDPDVHAAGDVANLWYPAFERHLRVEHWDNARNGGPAAARAMLGDETAYDHLPYFFTDQYDLGMEYTGYVAPGEYDEVVVRGELSSREFVAFWLAGGRVLAGMNVNIWDVTDPIARLVRLEETFDRGRHADPAVPLA